ncbi:ferric reductase transmembrane component 4 [Eremomyces bilateralis CBS 781.70]|uniref:Ferric reductase transmembrane component 4 n=1 Tax=Eremomyces bilateralis CBS 781.70 TaxID=1392243 RepID=A0A6G1G5K9_9PEZI|nr:ferric reductase transmembrane component 4 [Eremomyces bilateralis CBS 781.70]KAF1813119.1 ferric reductase transmembrane component 4 [Eremomyces bilateralis CBS 781.70]
MYDPVCASACGRTIQKFPLVCSTHGKGDHHGGGPMSTTPECRANDTSYLTTLAYCMKSKCAPSNIEAWRLEQWWWEKSTTDKSVHPVMDYEETLATVRKEPTRVPKKEDTLDFTGLITDASWKIETMAELYFEEQETLHARYGYRLRSKPYILYPFSIPGYHVRSLPWLIGNPPLVGQSIYIAIFFILNIVLTAGGYRSTQPNSWFPNRWQEIMAYVSCRTGVLAFAILPLLLLFSSRNNILLWCTNWSHSTFLLLHRWVGRAFALQVILHSIVELQLYIGMGSYKEELVKAYWAWGIVATMTTVLLVTVSVLWFRRISYEIFLILHIVLAIFCIVGSWYHVELLFYRKWGYELWLYAAIAVWAFDRILRVGRIAYTGLKQAHTTEVCPGIIRVDIPGVRWHVKPGLHAYLLFPTLSFRVWESHPFSVSPLQLRLPYQESDASSGGPNQKFGDAEKSANATVTVGQHSRKESIVGLRFYIRGATGLTSMLRPGLVLPCLVEGPYGNRSSVTILSSDRVVVIGGGIGITGLLAYLSSGHVNTKLYWGVKEKYAGLVADVEEQLGAGVEKEVRLGKRFVAEEVLNSEIEAGWKRIGVVVCGPPGLCDDVRAAVVRAGRAGKTEIELEVDAFSW